MLCGPAAARQEDALERYERWKSAALADELPPESACDVFRAAQRLYQARSDAVDPAELLRTAVNAARACPEERFGLLNAVEWSTRFLRGNGDPGEATRLLETTLPDLIEAFPEEPTTVLLEFNLLQLLREQDRWQEALDQARAMEPRVLASRVRTTFESTLYGERASLYLAWGLTDLAWRWHGRQREALDGASANARRHADLVEANLLLAETDDVRQYERAEVSILERLEDGTLYPSELPARGRLLVRAALARIGAADEDPERADEARELLDAALAIPGLEVYERRRAHLALAEIALGGEAWEPALDALDAATDARDGPPTPAVVALAATLRSALERRRGDRTRLADARERLAGAADDFLEAWRRLPLREGGFGFFLFRENQRIVGESIAAELALDDGRYGVERAFATVLRAQSLSSLARAIGGEHVPTLAEVRAELLRPGEGFLVVVPAPDGSSLFALDGAALTHHRLPPVGPLVVAHDRFLRRFLVPPRAGTAESSAFEREREAALTELSAAMLPADVRARIAGWRALTWVGTENLSALPCEELLVDGRPLGATVAMGHVDSLATALALERRRAARPRAHATSWLVASSDPGPEARAEGLVPLPFEASDAAELLGPLPGEKELRLLGDATLAALDEAREATYLVVVAHGARVPDEERPAGLRLADGIARCRDIETRSAPPLVALLACSTQSGPGRVGDAGAADLGGAFLRAGADCVLLSPFRIDFRAATALVADLHEGLARGATPAEALRDARREVLDDPNVDARLTPLRLIGLAHQAVFDSPADDPPRRSIAWIGPLLLGLLGLLVVARLLRRRP